MTNLILIDFLDELCFFYAIQKPSYKGGSVQTPPARRGLKEIVNLEYRIVLK